jgi:RNA polymerase sigma factor (TIGR02999 family)
MAGEVSEVTRLLGRIDEGDGRAAEQLMELVYGELRELAGQAMARERTAHTLQPTALVNEAWLRLVRPGEAGSFEGRRHFFGAAARAMRQILVDHARRRGRLKRGGEARRLELDEARLAALPASMDLLSLDDALRKLEAEDPDLVRLVELRYFTGLTIDETARVLDRSTATVERSWRVARAVLRRALGGEGA